jgi:hypothetical protein
MTGRERSGADRATRPARPRSGLPGPADTVPTRCCMTVRMLDVEQVFSSSGGSELLSEWSAARGREWSQDAAVTPQADKPIGLVIFATALGV